MDVTVIFEWIAQRSPDGAIRWLDAFEEAINQLRHNAANCSLAIEADDFGIDLRQSLFRTRRGKSYRLLFVIRGDVVYLAAVRGPGQEVVAAGDLELPE